MYTVIYSILMFLCGLGFGSFYMALVRRVSADAPIGGLRTCASCGVRIMRRDLVPIASWVLLRGKCRACGVAIGFAHPASELIFGLIFLGLVLWRQDLSAIPLALVCFVIIAISHTDIKTYTIPNGLVATAGGIGAVFVVLGHFLPMHFGAAPGFADAALGSLVGGGVLAALDIVASTALKKPAFGHGDIKLMAALGLFLGFRATVLALWLALVLGGLAGACLLIAGRARRGDYIAFGPYLCAGGVVAFAAGEHILCLAGLA